MFESLNKIFVEKSKEKCSDRNRQVSFFTIKRVISTSRIRFKSEHQKDLFKELKNIRECQAEMNKKLNEGSSISRVPSPSPSSLEPIRQGYIELRDFLIHQQETLVKELRRIQETQTTLIALMKTTETPPPLLVINQIDSVTKLFQVEQKNLSIKLDSVQTNINAISMRTNKEGEKLVQVLTNRMAKLFDKQKQFISTSLVFITTINHSSTVLIDQFFVQVRKSLSFLLVQLEQDDGNRKAIQISANGQ